MLEHIEHVLFLEAGWSYNFLALGTHFIHEALTVGMPMASCDTLEKQENFIISIF